MAYEKDPNEIGALWARESANGDYLTGEINGERVVCFRVKRQTEKGPAWRVLKSKPRDEKPSRRYEGAPSADDDSIPF